MLNKERVSLATVFYPETAPFRSQQNEENKWKVVWAEAHLMPDNRSESVTETVVEASTVTIDEPNKISEPQSPDVEGTAPIDNEDEDTSPPCYKANCLELTIGASMTVSAVAAAFTIDLAAAILYVLGAGFYHGADRLESLSGVFAILYVPFFFTAKILLFIDFFLLAVSIFITELLAWCAFILLCPFAGCRKGDQWHQYIRRICHLFRWAFRDFHHGWKPERTFPGGQQSPNSVS